MNKIYLVLLFFVTTNLFGQKVTTWAGKSQTAGTISGGESATAVRFNQPWGMAVDANGNIYVSNEGSHAIFMLNKSDGKYYVRAGKQGQNGYADNSGINAQFDRPMGIAVGTKVYIADAGNHVIRQMDQFSAISTAQNVSLLAGKKGVDGYNDGTGSAAQFNSPTDVAVDSKGNIYVADQGNHCIRMITTAGVVTTYAGQAGTSGSANGNKDSKATFSYPTGLFIDANDNIYVADKGNNRIRLITKSTDEVSTVYKDVYTPEQVFVDSYGSIIASGGCQIRGLNGTDTLIVGNHPRNCGFKNASDTNALLDNARGVLQISQTEYIFCDRDNHVLRKIEIDVCSAVKAKITAGGALQFCEGGSVTLTGVSGITNSWTLPSGSSSNTSISASTTGRYLLKVTATIGASSCQDTSSVFVKVNEIPKPSIGVTGSLSFCPGESVTLESVQSYTKYLWTTTETSKSIIIKSAGTFGLEVTDAKGCVGTASTVTTEVYSTNVPTISAGGDTKFCEGGSVELVASTGFSKYLWSTNGSGDKLTVSKSGKYSVTATDANGCETTSSETTIEVYPLPQKPDLLSQNDSLYTTAIAISYAWYLDGSLVSSTSVPFLIVSKNGKYSLVVSDKNLCENASDEIDVVITSTQKITKDLYLYPNPAKDFVRVENAGTFKYIITDITGRTRLSGTSNGQIQLSGLNSGTYFVRIIKENEKVLQKLVVLK